MGLIVAVVASWTAVGFPVALLVGRTIRLADHRAEVADAAARAWLRGGDSERTASS